MKSKSAEGLTTPELVDCRNEPVRLGDAVRLIKHHAHKGKVATYEGCTRTVAGWGARVRFGDGATAIVFRASEWERCDDNHHA